jgi:LysR family nitrogen assimilation transcriptional regulator
MTLDELRYFLKAAETGSMSRAAESIGMTQPALSRQVRLLELELKSDLFYRHGRGVSLTPSGIKLQQTAQQVLDQLDVVSREIQQDSSRAAGTITLGVPPSIGSTLCAPLSQSFARLYPEARLRIREGFSGSLSEMLEDGQLDLAILYDARRRRDLLVTPLLKEHLFFVSKLDDGNMPGEVGWKAIEKAKLVLPGPGNGMRRVIERAAKDAGVPLDVQLEIDSVSAIRQLVVSGGGQSILPYGAVHAEVRSGQIAAQRIAEPAMEAVLVIATPRNKPVTRTVRSVIKLIEKETLNCLESGILRGEYRPEAPSDEGTSQAF